MFTGIIQELAVVKILDRRGDLLRLGISASFANSVNPVRNFDKQGSQIDISNGVKKGSSIAVNGVCLTVIKIENGILFFDAISATLKTTNLGSLKLNDRVNLEQALGANDKISGHIVTGHIDTTAVIRKKSVQREQALNHSLRSDSGQAVFEITLDKKFAGNIVKKGSIAIDGVSLTVSDIKHDSFNVNIIPHTLKVTTLGFKGTGDTVNVEFDYLGKYTSQKSSFGITEDFLKEHGFLS